MDRTQAALVGEQFGPRAAAYVASRVHAEGPDLRRMAEVLRGRPGARVLDLGCGGGHVSYAAAPLAAEVVAYDLSGEMLAAVARTAAERGLTNVATRRGVAERLPFGEGRFDAVLCRFTADHWHDPEAGLREARRVLAPGGVAAFADAAALGRAGLAVTGLTAHRLRLEFASWVERMRTPAAHREAILSLQAGAPAEVRRHFAVGEDGSFTLDVLTLEAAPG